MDVKNSRCKHPGCTRQPNYGNEGGRAVFCSAHKLSRMVNVVSRRCEYPDCKRQVSYFITHTSPRTSNFQPTGPLSLHMGSACDRVDAVPWMW